MNRFIALIFYFFVIHTISAQYIVLPSPIKWYNIERAMELNKKAPKPILIDVYADWCSWCNYMLKTTFSNTGIANYINKHFYPIRFNSSSLDTVEFEGREYINRKVGKKPTHDLATYLLENKLSYPSIVYYNLSGKKTVVPGFKESKDIEPILVYQVENLSNNVSLAEFTANFMYTFPTDFEKDHSIFKIPRALKPDTLGKPNWVKPETVNLKNKKKRKPTIIFFYSDDCISCKVMEKTTFGNQYISNLLNKNFYLVKINVFSQEKIMFLGRWYKGKGEHNPNGFTKVLLKKDIKLPAVVFFDKNGKQVNKENAYLTVKHLDVLIQYFTDKKYKTISYNEYLKGAKAANNNRFEERN